MLRILIGFLIVGTGVFLLVVTHTRREAATLFLNGRVYTLAGGAPAAAAAEGAAVAGGRILAVGRRDDLVSRYPGAAVVDCAGGTILPGLIDGHAHMIGLGRLMRSILLYGLPSPDTAATLLRERAAGARPGEWIIGRGWDQNLWPVKEFPTAAMLDSAAPSNPVVFIRVDGHAIWVNSRAMADAGITAGTPDPAGGRIIRDAGGKPTGIFVEQSARDLVESHIPPMTEGEIDTSLLSAAHACVAAGLTEVGDMGLDSTLIAAYLRLADAGKLPLRIYGAVGIPGDAWQVWRTRGPLIRHGMFTLRTVKLYADGALGSRGAALVESYADDPGNRGTTVSSEEEIASASRDAMLHGFQPAVHAIGDRANHFVLDAYEKALASVPPGDYRPRIEHVQVLLPDDLPRFRRLGVLPSMEPVHATSDMPWAGARLGPQRIHEAYAWHSIIAGGNIIIGGSDFPNDDMHPLRGIYAAVTRTDREGNPPGGWLPEERMSREEAIRAYTTWAARGAFEESFKGTIEPGRAADFTILGGDPFTSSPAELLSMPVLMTVVDGNVVYDRSKDHESGPITSSGK